ncbi:ninjurin-2 [Myxocyprinus asiaticus]|uniref:ninjurin-2 n=1 Tax=Myxocyprinus asiaticus TaxID=70543 RepID=UPI002222AF47|nr:ninjurin-2 [Myxocyprinus asiaticus]
MNFFKSFFQLSHSQQLRLALNSYSALKKRKPCRKHQQSPSAMPATRGHADLQPAEPLNMNHYATKKTVAESMLDVALLMANASQLKAVLEQGPEFKYYLTVIILIAVSLFFQVLAGALFVNMARKNLNEVANQRKLDIMNNVATAMVFLTVIINIFITAFGVQKTGLYPKQ